MDNRPIGIFDSGFGGLTVARAIIDLLPNEDIVYFGDTGRYPYGPRPLTEVKEFATQIARHLVNDFDVKALVVACNNACAAALSFLQNEYEIPTVGVIEPGMRAAARTSRNHRVGVIGTEGTIKSGAYQRMVKQLSTPIELVATACPGFVEFVETGETEGEPVRLLAKQLLTPVRDAQVDTLLLGCTHYPFLTNVIGEVMGDEVVLVSSAEETAFEVRSVLESRGLTGQSLTPGKHRFISSGNVDWFKELGARLLGPEVEGVEALTWE